VLLDALTVDAGEFARATGWTAKPEGLCKGDVCVPAPGARLADGTLDVALVAQRLGMPVVSDDARGLHAVGPATVTGRALCTAEAPELELPDRDGNPFRLSALHGRKVLLVAWASW
jgi:hypothetical protein